MKKQLALLALALTVGSALPANAGSNPVDLSDEQIGRAAHLSAIALCFKKKLKTTPFPEFNNQRVTNQQVIARAWQEAGISMNRTLKPGIGDALLVNMNNIYDALDGKCKQVRQVEFQEPKRSRPVEAVNGPTYMRRQAERHQRCHNELGSKYLIYTQGQFSDCLTRNSLREYMGR